MNFPFSNNYQNYSHFQAYENQWTDLNREIQSYPTNINRYYDSYNNLMYYQMVPILPSFYSFPNCQTGIATLNTLSQEKKNEQSRGVEKSGENRIETNKNIMTLKNLDLIDQLINPQERDEANFIKIEDNTPALTKKIYKQNPTRNIITNIGNQLITFLSSRRKSQEIIQKLCPNWTQQQFNQYYTYAQKVKSETDYYLNLDKMKSFWYKRENRFENEKFQKIIRILSAYYLNQILSLSILTSKKMKKQSKILHLRAKRQLLIKLKNSK